MKDINEYTAEVFRRSEKKIKEQKRNRARIFALCVPLFLIVSVCSALFLPVSSMRKKDGNIANGENHTESDCQYIALEIYFNGLSAEHYEKVTNSTDVAELFGIIDSLFVDADGESHYVDGEAMVAGSNDSQYGTKDKGYTMIFTGKDSSMIKYRLIGNTLINEKENKTVFLDNEEVAALMTALGISDK